MLGPLREVSDLLARSRARFRTRTLIAASALVVGLSALVVGLVLLHDSDDQATPSAQSSVVPSPPPRDPPAPSVSAQTTPPVPATSAPVAAPPVAAPPAYQTPSYAVGVTTVDIVDTSRPTEARGDRPASASRTLGVTIRYPVAGSASSSESAGAAARSGTFPLVVFAHGYNVSAATYAALEHELAAAGFIVAAPDFPLTSSAIPGPPDENDVVHQAGDVSFVITTLLTLGTTPTVIVGHVAATQVGVVGHSDGAITAAAVAYNSTSADPRIGAAAVLAGEENFYPGTWFTTASPPLLAVQGTADTLNPYHLSQKLYNDATTPKYLVSVRGGTHLEPFTTDAIRPAISTLIADFLTAQLEHNPAASARIGSDANVGVLQLVGT